MRKAFGRYWNVRYCIGSIFEAANMKKIFGKSDRGRSCDSLVLLLDKNDGNVIEQDNIIYKSA